MKKNILYIITLTVFTLASGFIFFKYRKDVEKREIAEYVFLERKGYLAQTAEWSVVRKKASALIKQAKENPSDIRSLLALTSIYLQEARITGNYIYYDMAAMKCVNDILKKDPGNFEALTFKAMIFLSQHHFAEGLAVAEKAQQINPYNSFVYGLLVDGNVEAGNYAAAVENSDKMVSLRPDIRSYSRIGYLREIHGDNEGAIAAMKLAVDAGPPGDEGTEWARSQLGKLYEYTGNLKEAEKHYLISLQNRPGYPYALAGMARIAVVKKEFRKALDYYQSAVSIINDYSFMEEIGEIYLLSGQEDSAFLLFNEIINRMVGSAKQSLKHDDSTGHYTDREMAHAWLKVNNYEKALEHALLEYNRRPENIDVNETMAWVLYHKGDYAKALQYINKALKTNCKNPVLLCRAGLIFAKSGDKMKAELILREALKNNPNIPETLKAEGLNVLQNL